MFLRTEDIISMLNLLLLLNLFNLVFLAQKTKDQSLQQDSNSDEELEY